MMRNNKYGWGLLSAALVALTSCSTEALSEYERTQNAFLENLNGKVSPMQMWRTAVKLNVQVTAPAPVKVWLVSDPNEGTIYDYKELAQSGNIELVAPQTSAQQVYLITYCNHLKKSHVITLTGRTEETVTIKVSNDYTTVASSIEEQVGSAHTQAKDVDANVDRSELYGNSIAGNALYYQFTTDQKNEALDLLKDSYREGVNAKSLGMNCDYELGSKGSFNITWFSGNTKSASPHILGYYYHSPGTYDDIQYIDLSETEVFDYIDGLAKVQYQVNQDAASEFGVQANHWYDANFDVGDTYEEPSPYIQARLGDDSYNCIDVYKRYGSNLSAIRGISFTIDVPVGKRVGFYMRDEKTDMPEQYDRFVKLGIRPYTSRDKYKNINFSCEAMNMDFKGTHRSCIVEHSHSYWLGMEDNSTGGDLDCNDLIFGVTADLDIYKPEILEPDIINVGDKMPWTIAYEDVHRDADYDFNDAVIKVVPDYEAEKCCVYVMAAGSTNRMYLHYDGPDGDQNLGEIHELLGGRADTEINTQTSVAQYPFVSIDCVKWPKEYNMAEDAKRFYIEVKRGTCENCSDVITLAQEAGKTPEALLIAGEWKWPREGVNIMRAYDTFANWSKDVSKMAYWNWYAYPKSNTYVNY